MEIQIKTCTKCGDTKPIGEFYKRKGARFGVNSRCKICIDKCNRKWARENPEKVQIANKKWRKTNPEKSKAVIKRWAKANPEKMSANVRKWARKNPEKACAISLRWQKENPEKVRAMRKRADKKRSCSPMFKLNKNISVGIRESLNGNKNGRRWEGLVGYTIENLKKHLEKQFIDGMSWDNYGEWHIDHKIPKSVFNFTDVCHADFRKCWALSNLQPLFANDNFIKSNKLERHFQPSLLLQENL